MVQQKLSSMVILPIETEIDSKLEYDSMKKLLKKLLTQKQGKLNYK